jgi:hypothetical protein
MANILRTAAIGCGLAGALALAAAMPASAQGVVGPYYASPGAYVGPYGAYAYAPGYGSWDYPAGYDTGGAPYYHGELGWQPGPPSVAPANPCFPSQRAQNRC